MSARDLAHDVLGIVEGVLIHQRQRWGQLLGHQRGYEGWWKAEIAAAIESWTWALPQEYTLVVEPKPRTFGHGDAAKEADIVVAPYSAHEDRVSTTHLPRVWLELKERGTWWQGGPDKALGTANHGVLWDLQKWSGIRWNSDEVAVACHILVHDGEVTTALPKTWQDALDDVARTYPRYRRARTVGYPLDDKHVRWARLDVFTIHGTP